MSNYNYNGFMKKFSLLLTFSLAFLFSVIAQENVRVVSSDTIQKENDGKNWFLGAGAQGNVYANHNFRVDSKVWEKPSLAGNLFVGKWLSHKVGLRLLGEYGTLHPFFQKSKSMDWMVDERYALGRLDLMVNVTNLFRHYSPDRFYNLIAYVGPGYGESFGSNNRPDDKSGSSTFLGGAGLLNTFRLSNHVALFVNIGGNITDAKFDGWKAGDGNKQPSSGVTLKDDSKLNGFANGAIGLIYNFGSSSKKEVVAPPVVVQEQPQPAKYTLALSSNDTNCGSVSGAGTFNEGTRVTAVATPKSGCRFVNWTENGTPVSTSSNYSFPLNANRTLVANYEAIPAPPKVVEPAKVVLEPVFFRIDKSIIDPEQEIKVQRAAEFLKSNPGKKLNVVGYADVQTAYPKYNMALSQRRSKAVANQLIKKYGISADRLILNWHGDTIQPFAINEKNRVVMFSE